MNIKQLHDSDYIIFQAIVGSKLYGLDTPESDTDYKGLFLLPNQELFKLSHPRQISDDTNDTTFYEVKRFLQLAQSANPNILELLYVPENKVIKQTEVFDKILTHRDLFLTKEIRNSLGGYAIAQIKKARGQNKKIVNPIEKERKDLLDFCFVLTPLGSVPFKEWVSRQRGAAQRQENYGASKVNNAHNMYYIFYNQDRYDFKGLIGKGSNELRMSSIPKETSAHYSIMYCNTEGYSTYCKDYREYWEWVNKRNQSRYNDNAKHGKGYDGKNLMHCFRLLEMGIDAAKHGEFIVERENREWLLKVRRGEFEYKDLVDLAEEKLEELDTTIRDSSLPDRVSNDLINSILLDIRNG